MERRIDGGAIAAGLGALLVFVSLFLDWFEPDLSAWTVFEALDMVLAALCLATFILIVPKALGRPVVGGPPESLLLGIGTATFVIVGIQLLNHPPAAIGLDEEVGAWLALGGSVLMLAGGVLSRTRITFSVTVREAPGESRPRSRASAGDASPPPAEPAAPPPSAEPGATAETRRIADDQNA
jgi:hypothetical protein